LGTGVDLQKGIARRGEPMLWLRSSLFNGFDITDSRSFGPIAAGIRVGFPIT
jgi:hypothetical protein